MPLRWKFFRLLCIAQLLLAAFSALAVLISFFYSISFAGVAVLLLYAAILFMCVLGINLVNNNYPDEPVQGIQKKSFNRIFLINFLFLSFLFSFVIAEFRSLKELTIDRDALLLSLPFRFYMWMLVYLVMLLLQLVILYGLYRLRLELQDNFAKKKFDFE